MQISPQLAKVHNVIHSTCIAFLTELEIYIKKKKKLGVSADHIVSITYQIKFFNI